MPPRKNHLIKKKKCKEFPASKQLGPNLETIISEVSNYYEIKHPQEKAVRRGIESEACDVIIYLIRTMCAGPLMRLVAVFDLSPGIVLSAVR
jgi:hypothetical protein